MRFLLVVVPVLDLLALLLSRGLAVLEVGDETARGLGVPVTRTRLVAVVVGVVLAAMGVEPALAAGALRISLGWNTVDADLDRVLAAFERAASSLYQRQGRAA